ncbi:DUF4860 domain-containing protein [Muricaecibacterium torontonense]|uniref:DUF4860 domain-containing protein n=2 Tax=Muricaecibacterium torontonense TaxID=3032871 RepID=A0A4S2F0X5_9ACTN|nr:DUF4860 domain-containing protein [Muricaecibacterium torontonense]
MTPPTLPHENLLRAKGTLAIAQGHRPAAQKVHPMSTILVILLLLVSVAALGVGAQVYSSIHQASLTDDSSRLASALLSNTVRSQDRALAVESTPGPEGPVLKLVSHLDSGDYETRLYLYQGQVVREFALAASPLTPQSAVPIMPSKSFSFALEGDLLTLATDKGATSVALRSPQSPQSLGVGA